MKLNEKVLLVEDDPMMLELWKITLTDFAVVTAANGAEALEKFKQEKIFLVVSDLKMPVMNGLELLKEIKALRPEVPFYILSGFGDKDMLMEGVNNLLNGYYDKPIALPLLIDLVERESAKRIRVIEEEQLFALTFLEDLVPLLDDLDQKIFLMKEDCNSLQDIKRILHTIKGTSSFVKSMQPIEELCHKSEDMIKELTQSGRELDHHGRTLLLELVALLRLISSELKQDLNSTHDISTFLAKLNTLEHTSHDQTVESIGPSLKDLSGEKAEYKSKGIMVTHQDLDQIMDLAGEMVMIRNGLYGSITSAKINTQEIKTIKSVYEQINAATNTLQKKVMDIRKVPIASVLSVYRRIVWDLSKKMDKEIKLILEDNDVFVDKDIAAQLKDSLVHIIRNCIDHGIEDRPTRLQCNKPPEGVISIAAQATKEGIKIIITDDGKGIDPDKVAQSALQKGIISEHEMAQMNPQAKCELIFRAGLSTAERVTHVSGRGEGMDIVCDALKKIDGTIHIDSRVGEGTRFILAIPHHTSLNVVRLSTFCTGEKIYGIPNSKIEKITKIMPNDLSFHAGNLYLNLNNEVIKVLSFKAIVEGHKIQKKEDLTLQKSSILILLKTKKKNIGILVDDILDQFDAVLREMSSELTSYIALFSNLAMLSDGQPCLVLDPEALPL